MTKGEYMNKFKPYTQTDVVSFYKELVKRWADDQLDQLADYPITKRKQMLVDLVQSNLEVFREDILEEINSRKLSYLVD
jgi:hypothetical protein